MKPGDVLREKLASALFQLGLGILVLPFLLAGFNAVLWLKTGVWSAHTVETVVLKINPEWYITPRDWKGLHELIVWSKGVPLFLLWFPIGLLISKLGITVSEG